MTMERIAIEITMVIDAIGTEQTQYFATSGFTTKPTDTPANTYFAPRIKSAGSLKRELFSGARVTGAVRPSFGEIVLFNGDGGLDAWMGYGISGGKVVVRMGPEDGAYPADYTTIYIARAQHLVADFKEIRIRIRDRLLLLEQPMVTAQFAGTGGLEGASTMAGKLKQWVSSDPGWFEPILIDPASRLYFVQSTGVGSLGSYVRVYEGAVEIPRGADYPDEATCLGSWPASGQARFWLGAGGNGPVYFRLGSVPQFDIRVYSHGLPSPSTGYGSWSKGMIARMAGITDAPLDAGFIGPILVDDNSTYMQVLEDSCPAMFQYFGMTRLDVFFAGTLTGPGTTPLYTFDHRNAQAWSRTPVQDMDAPVWSVIVNSGECWPSNVAAGADANYKDWLSRDPWQHTFSRSVAAIRAANPGAISATVEIKGRIFPNSFARQWYLDRYFERYGVRRDFYTCTVQLTPETLALELHDTVAIKMPRFGLDAGRNFRVVTQQIDCDKRQITYGMWG